MGKYVGIDLGTTFSVVSYIDEKGNPVIIPNKQGENTTPSVVLFGKDKPVIGSVAKRKSIMEPHNYEAFVKRHMGEKTYTFTTKNGETYRPEEISALILAKLKNDAEEYLGDTVDGAVITVPAYFGDPQIQATKDAAKAAGINVLDTISEPTAAAIAFGISKNVEKKQKVMVYDFGGGTFDVSILDIDQSHIKVISTNGDYQLGGYDIDMALVNYVKEKAKEEGIDIDKDIRAQQDLMIQAENAKKELSSADSTDIYLYVQGEEFSVTIDRETFEDLIADILDLTITTMYKALADADLDYPDLDKILLVGGSTRIPAVRKMIEEETEITPSSEVHPDEAVAIGAAYHAVDVVHQMAEGTFKSEVSAPDPKEKKSEQKKVDAQSVPELEKKYTFQDIISHGIGVIVYDAERGKDINSVIMPKNTPIPAEVVQDGYSTVEPYQSALRLTVTQGEYEEVEYTTIIGEADMEIRPRAELVPIRCIVSCDRSGVIHVRAVDLDENLDLGEVTIDRSRHNMSEEEVRTAAIRVSKLSGNKLDIGE